MNDTLKIFSAIDVVVNILPARIPHSVFGRSHPPLVQYGTVAAAGKEKSFACSRSYYGLGKIPGE